MRIWGRSSSIAGPGRREGSAAERRATLLALGYNSLAYIALYDGWEYFHAEGIDGFIAFERHNRVATACGEPVCGEGDTADLVAAFRAWCAAEGLTPAFAGASARFARACSEDGWEVLKIGEEPILDTATYGPRGNGAKKVRSAANHGRKAGVSIEVLAPGRAPSPATAAAMESVAAAWRESRKVTALGFMLRLHPLDGITDKVVALAWYHGRLEGFATCLPIPARGGVCIEDLIRAPGAPTGVSELLVLAVVEACRERGLGSVNLGLAPLRGAAAQPHGHRAAGWLLQVVSRRASFFYGFRSLEHFKAKFQPTAWEDAFLVYRPQRLARTSMALLTAFTPGTLGPLTTALSRFRRIGPRDRRWTPAEVAGGVATGAAAAAMAAVALHYPALVAPVSVPGHGLAHAAAVAERLARAHPRIDSMLLLGAGGLYVRSARGG